MKLPLHISTSHIHKKLFHTSEKTGSTFFLPAFSVNRKKCPMGIVGESTDGLNVTDCIEFIKMFAKHFHVSLGKSISTVVDRNRPNTQRSYIDRKTTNSEKLQGRVELYFTFFFWLNEVAAVVDDLQHK